MLGLLRNLLSPEHFRVRDLAIKRPHATHVGTQFTEWVHELWTIQATRYYDFELVGVMSGISVCYFRHVHPVIQVAFITGCTKPNNDLFYDRVTLNYTS